MINLIMETKIRMNLEDNEVSDFRCNAEGWNFLETETSHECDTVSYFRWAYASADAPFMSRITLRVGEHNPEMRHKNRYFVSGSRFCSSFKLHRTHTFDTTQKEIDRIAEETNAKYAKDWNWEEKYPEIKRYGIKPTEMELESMSNEERSKLPKYINYVW
jgi:hypothetical protein